MIPVASAEGVTLLSPSSGIVAFHSSPYPVHVQGGAVDIFTGREFNVPAISPVSGKVNMIDKSKVGVPRHFKSDPHDYIISLEVEDVCVRLLHVEPSVEVGDFVEVGDEIGKYIRTPLLPFWSYPHAHCEVKDCKDTQSPLDAFPLTPEVKGRYKGAEKKAFSSFSAKVKLFTSNYILVTPELDMHGKVGNFHGIAVSVGTKMGILDAQTPWNAYGGVILGERSDVKIGDEVRFGEVLLGKVERIMGNYASYVLGGELGDGIDRYSKGLLYKDVGRFNVPYKRIKVNDEVYLGISTGLFLHEDFDVRLVPLRPLEKEMEIGEELNVELSNEE
jgi:hypothetical protein